MISPTKSVNGMAVTDIATLYAMKDKKKWPLRKMKAGDEITAVMGEYGKSHPQVYPHSYGKRTGKKFSSRHMGDGSYRITRIE